MVAVKHTPGPWRTTGVYIDSDFGTVCHATFSADLSSGSPEANARLIAAAPDLLEAGQKLMRSIQEMDPEQRGCSTVAYAEMFEAIAKATQP